MSRIEQIVTMLREEQEAHDRAARRLDRLVAENQERLGEAANSDPLTLALNAQCDVATGRVVVIRSVLGILGEHFEV